MSSPLLSEVSSCGFRVLHWYHRDCSVSSGIFVRFLDRYFSTRNLQSFLPKKGRFLSNSFLFVSECSMVLRNLRCKCFFF